jgi:hypothetical protein
MPSICFFVPLLTTWSISTNFSNLPQHKIWRKFVQWELSCSMRAYGRPDIPTDRHDHATSRFSELWERASEATKPTSAHVSRNASFLLQPCCPGDRFTRYRLPNKGSVAHRSHFPVQYRPQPDYRRRELRRRTHHIGGTADFGRWISDAQWSDASRRA